MHRVVTARTPKASAADFNFYFAVQIARTDRQEAIPTFGVLPIHLRTNPIGMLPARAEQLG
jgi:hypothetical protein